MALPFLWTKRAVRLTAALFGFWVMASATVPYWSPYLTESVWYGQASWWFHAALDLHLSPTIHHRLQLSEGERDALIAFMGLLVVLTNDLWGKYVTPLACILLYPVLYSRVRLEIDKDFVSVRRWWGVQRFRRTGKMLLFTMTAPSEYFDKRFMPELKATPYQPHFSDNPPTIVELLVGKQRNRLFTTQRLDVAEAIVLACQSAFMKAEVEGGRAAPLPVGELSTLR